MKKLLPVLLALLLLLTACGSAGAPKPTDPYDEGLEAIALLKDMIQSEAYVEIIYGADRLSNLEGYTEICSGSYDTVTAVYEIKLSDQIHSLLEIEEYYKELPDSLVNVVDDSFPSAFISKVTQKKGFDAVLLQSIYVASVVFFNPDVTENMIYLYTFESGLPIVVTFSVREDGIISGTTKFLFATKEDTASAEAVEAFFEEGNPELELCTVKKIK